MRWAIVIVLWDTVAFEDLVNAGGSNVVMAGGLFLFSHRLVEGEFIQELNSKECWWQNNGRLIGLVCVGSKADELQVNCWSLCQKGE